MIMLYLKSSVFFLIFNVLSLCKVVDCVQVITLSSRIIFLSDTVLQNNILSDTVLQNNILSDTVLQNNILWDTVVATL